MKNIFFTFISILLITSCSTHKKEEEKDLDDADYKQKSAKIAREGYKKQVIEGLVSKYKIAYNLDTVQPKYSIDYNPIINTTYQILNRIIINDIYEKDSIFIVSLRFIGRIDDLTFSVSKEQKELFLNKNLDLILVIKLKSVKKIKFVFKGEIQDEETVDVSLENSTGFYASADLIEIASLKK